MQRLCSKFRPLAAAAAVIHSHYRNHRLLHHVPRLPLPTPILQPSPRSLLHTPMVSTQASAFVGQSSLPPFSFVLVRHRVTVKKKLKRRGRLVQTPLVSKLKKYKMKTYSSFKDRFKPLADGTIRRWKEGKRHNAHIKSKKAKFRGRQPGLVPIAYAKVMKKLGFCS